MDEEQPIAVVKRHQPGSDDVSFRFGGGAVTPALLDSILALRALDEGLFVDAAIVAQQTIERKNFRERSFEDRAAAHANFDALKHPQ
jgi:hypothetical protein